MSSPLRAPIFREVRDRMADSSGSTTAWDELCYSLNAHPQLRAHDRVFAKVQKLLSGHPFVTAEHWASRALIDRIPLWRGLLGNWARVLREVDRHPQWQSAGLISPAGKGHPMQGHGVTKAPLVAALWCDHETTAHISAASKDTASRFMLLQSMVLAAAMELRWHGNTTPDDYLQFDTETNLKEFDPYPVSIAPAARCVRWLAKREQTAWAQLLPHAHNPLDYLLQLKGWEQEVLQSLAQDTHLSPTKDAQRAVQYASDLTNFLDKWETLLTAGQSHKFHARKAHGSSSRPPADAPPDRAHLLADTSLRGEAATDHSPAATKPQPSPTESALENLLERGRLDEESRLPLLPHPLNPERAFAGGRSESAGREPHETPLVCRLEYDRKTLSREVSSQKWGLMASPTRGMNLPWALDQYAKEEVRSLLEWATTQTVDPFSTDPQAALLSSLCMVLGRKPEQLCGLKLLSVAHLKTWASTQAPSPHENGQAPCPLATLLNHPLSDPILIFDWERSGSEKHQSPLERARAIAWVLPSISPRLKANTDAGHSLTHKSSLHSKNIVLPQAGWGQWVLQTVCQRGWPDRSTQSALRRQLAAALAGTAASPPMSSTIEVFSWWPSQPQMNAAAEGAAPNAEAEIQALARDRAKDFLGHASKPLSGKPWVAGRLWQQMSHWVHAQHGDATLAWILFSDTSKIGEARLHYTQYTLSRLAQTWQKALTDAGFVPPVGPRLVEGQPPPADTVDLVDAPAATFNPVWKQRCTGAPFIADLAGVKALLQTLQAQVQSCASFRRASELARCHNAYVLYVLLMQGLCTAMRAVREPVFMLRAVEQHDWVQQLVVKEELSESTGDGTEPWLPVGLADKETLFRQRAHLVWIPPMLTRQLRDLRLHMLATRALLPRRGHWFGSEPNRQALFVLDAEGSPQEVTVAWMEKELQSLGYPWAGNFTRGFVRTRLLEQGCAEADLNHLLGHQDQASGAILEHSSFDVQNSRERLRVHLQTLHERIGLVHLQSAVPLACARGMPLQHLLAPRHTAGPKGRGRSQRPRHHAPYALQPNSFWERVRTKASVIDQAQLEPLLALLNESAQEGNAFAALLLGESPISPTATAPSAAELKKGEQRFSQKLKNLAESDAESTNAIELAASKFRLLAAATSALAKDGVSLPATPLVPTVRAPASPYQEEALLVAPIVQAWQAALWRWATQAFKRTRARTAGDGVPNEPPSPAPTVDTRHPKGIWDEQAWAAALLMSAALNGMALDLTQLSLLLDRFCDSQGRSLGVSTEDQRAHLDFWLPSNGSVRRQLHRWWLDPTTELIWMHAPPMSQTWRLGELEPWLRRITIVGCKSSVEHPVEPRSWSDLVRCAAVWWLTQASRTAVASARRDVPCSSVLSDRWSRLQVIGRLNPAHQTGNLLVTAEQLVMPENGAAPPKSSAPSQAPAALKGRGGAASLKAATQLAHSEFLSLAEVHYDHSGGANADKEIQAIDSQILANFAALYPWLEAAQQHLKALDHPAANEGWQPRSLADWQSLLPPSANLLEKALAAFAHWLSADDPSCPKGAARERSFTAAAQALLMESGWPPDAHDLLAKEPEEGVGAGQLLAELALRVSELPAGEGATVLSQVEALHRMAAFLDVREDFDATLADWGDEEDVAPRQHLTHADAKLISFEEFDHAMSLLLDDPLPRTVATAVDASEHAHLRGLARLLLTLCFRLGLRPAEAYGLRLRDVCEHSVYVLPYEGHGLKSANAQRRIPLETLLESEQRIKLATFLQQQRQKWGRGDDDRVFSSISGEKVSREKLDRVVHAALRKACADASVRLYHCRHSCVSWLDLAMRSTEHPQVRDFFKHAPQTSQFLEKGAFFCQALCGSQAASLGRISLTLARLVGHVGPAITHMHYLHFDDLVRAAVVSRVVQQVPLREAVNQWGGLLGIKRSLAYRLIGGPQRSLQIIQRARKQMGWTVTALAMPAHLVSESETTKPTPRPAPSPPSKGSLEVSHPLPALGLYQPSEQSAIAPVDSPERRPVDPSAASGLKNPPPPISVWRLLEVVTRWTEFSRPAERVRTARRLGLEPEQLQALITRIQAQHLMVAVGGSKAGQQEMAESFQEALRHEQRLLHLEEVFAHQASIRPHAWLADLEFLLGSYDRRGRWFEANTEEGLARLVGIFERLELEPKNIEIVLSCPAGELPACASGHTLGPYAACDRQYVKPRSASRASSYAKVCALRPMESQSRGWGRVLGIAALLGKVVLEWGMDSTRASNAQIQQPSPT